jgi:hypothetical protein
LVFGALLCLDADFREAVFLDAFLAAFLAALAFFRDAVLEAGVLDVFTTSSGLSVLTVWVRDWSIGAIVVSFLGFDCGRLAS